MLQQMLFHQIKGGADMRKEYDAPMMEMIQYEMADIITTSGYDPDEDSTEIVSW